MCGNFKKRKQIKFVLCVRVCENEVSKREEREEEKKNIARIPRLGQVGRNTVPLAKENIIDFN